MDNFFFVKSNLIQEPKHRQKMGEAIWLYLYFLSYSNNDPMREKMNFYLGTYCKRLQIEQELVKSQLKLLKAEGYITLRQQDQSCYNITIKKPIKTR